MLFRFFKQLPCVGLPSWKGILDMILRLSRALDITSYVALGIPEIQGHFQVAGISPDDSVKRLMQTLVECLYKKTLLDDDP